MRLTREEHGERLERFGEIKSASRLWGRPCGAPEPGAARICTRPRGHRGLHASHSPFGSLLSVWQTDGVGVEPTAEAQLTRSASRSDRAVRAEDAPGVPARIGRWLLRVLSSPEELSLVILFLGLVAWGLSVALRIVSAW
jgi:hypothetical protein